MSRLLLPRLLAAGVFLGALRAVAQVGTAPVEGLREINPRVHALINARLEIAPGQTVARGCLVVRDGLIAAAGADVQPPSDARVWDLGGQTVYAGFIDAHSHFGLPEKMQPAPLRPEKRSRKNPPPRDESTPPGTGSWNPLVTPEREAARAIQPDEKTAGKWRALGFTNTFAVPGRGIFRGQGAFVDLTGQDGNRPLLQAAAIQDVAFELGGQDRYPDSLMGCVALIRQTFLDADWYARAQRFHAAKPAAGERPEISDPLAALETAARGETPVIIETEDELDLPRAARLADEFKLKAILRGSGYEYRVMDALKASRLPVILPLAFPEAPEVESPGKALDVGLDALEHWDQAASNPARLAAAGVPFAITAGGLEKPEKTFWKNVRQAVRRGWKAPDALGALTVAPARLLGVEARYGTLAPGKVANFIVCSGDLFTEENAAVTAAWIGGEPFETEKGRQRDPRGEYALTYEVAGVSQTISLKIEGEPGKLKVAVAGQGADASAAGEQLVMVVPGKAFGGGESDPGRVRLAADLTSSPGDLRGVGQLGLAPFRWRAKRTAPFHPPAPKAEEAPAPLELPPAYPAGAFGRRLDGPQPSGIALVQNATIWTCGPAGKLEHADLLIRHGRIEQVGPGLIAPAGARIIDGAGMHVTPGLIDCHSHTAISRGINEATHAVTCEVRVGDVLDATDIALYRELAGGVTTANVLHGSSNPIGGQNQPIKLRWGAYPEDLKFGGAMPGVKFALGENVKQSNWGDRYTSRYPQTRMGVEEILRDTFLAARDYERQWSEFNARPAETPPPRRDLRLEAALEILRRKRIVHVHSYRQDEILMFIRLAQELGFAVGTFQHVLEGYKVADEIAKIGAGASSFSDWWAYKPEAFDAIPYNGAMLQRAGVVVSFNSDSNELARRLNTEAAKAVKYGGLSEEQALDFVTINPARQLRIDRQTGSLEVGKDADFVLWTGSPLSTYSRAEQTWVDGVCYFDYRQDQQARQDQAARRERLIQKALPIRQKALGADPKEEREDKPAPGEFERLRLHGAIHRALEWQGLYHNGADKHNCSTSSW